MEGQPRSPSSEQAVPQTPQLYMVHGNDHQPPLHLNEGENNLLPLSIQDVVFATVRILHPWIRQDLATVPSISICNSPADDQTVPTSMFTFTPQMMPSEIVHPQSLLSIPRTYPDLISSPLAIPRYSYRMTQNQPQPSPRQTPLVTSPERNWTQLQPSPGQTPPVTTPGRTWAHSRLSPRPPAHVATPRHTRTQTRPTPRKTSIVSPFGRTWTQLRPPSPNQPTHLPRSSSPFDDTSRVLQVRDGCPIAPSRRELAAARSLAHLNAILNDASDVELDWFNQCLSPAVGDSLKPSTASTSRYLAPARREVTATRKRASMEQLISASNNRANMEGEPFFSKVKFFSTPDTPSPPPTGPSPMLSSQSLPEVTSSASSFPSPTLSRRELQLTRIRGLPEHLKKLQVLYTI